VTIYPAINVRRGRRSGLTYAELLTVVGVFGVLAGLAVATVRLRPSEAEIAARTFAADVAYAQAEAMARPDLGCIIKINPASSCYWLARPATPDTPITNSITKRPYLVQFGSGSGSRLSATSLGSYNFGGDAVLGFDAFGALDQSQDASIAFQASGESYTVTISAVTGIATVSRSGSVIEVGGGEKA
jgi:Tfp pilus assembly protein FimT